MTFFLQNPEISTKSTPTAMKQAGDRWNKVFCKLLCVFVVKSLICNISHLSGYDRLNNGLITFLRVNADVHFTVYPTLNLEFYQVWPWLKSQSGVKPGLVPHQQSTLQSYISKCQRLICHVTSGRWMHTWNITMVWNFMCSEFELIFFFIEYECVL